MKTYLEYISGKAFSLESKLKDEFLLTHFFFPLKIDTKIKYADVRKQIERLIKLYQDTAGVGSLDASEDLYYLIRNQYFYCDEWIGQHDSSIDQFFQATKKASEQLLSIKGQRQNLRLEIVIRNLLIIGANIVSCSRLTSFATVDVYYDSVGYLCAKQIDHLFQHHFSSFNGVSFSDFIACAQRYGGLPITYTIWREDPNDNRSTLSKLIHGKIEIATDSKITRNDCKQAMLFYAVLLTALVTKLEATLYG